MPPKLPSLKRRILGVDPGLTTGLALIEFSPVKILVAAELDPDAVSQWVHALLVDTESDPVVAIAIERFTITARTIKLSRQNDALEVIGAVKAMVTITGGTVLTATQTPSDAKSTWPTERLKLHDLNVKGGHARDALRHAMLYLQRNYPSVVVAAH